MKKRLFSILLSLAMVITMMPAMALTAFATGTSYAITNGTPESAKETNHGYITVDETAAEGEIVTVTVNPAEGYQLKSLTVTPTSAVPAGFVDLGIKDAEGKPLYWKETNLGASQAEEYGYYYFWGGTIGYTYKDTKWVNAKTSEELSGGFSSTNAPYYESIAYAKYTGSDFDILQPVDDAATTANLNWRIPTIAEFQDLMDKCYWEWTDNYKGSNVKGVIVYRAEKDEDAGKYKGQEGYTTSNTHIFLPAAGDGVNKSLSNVNNNALYWSSTLKSSNVKSANCILCSNSSKDVTVFVRSCGFPIRPVTTSSDPGITPAKQQDGTYQFTMPGYAVTVTAEFEEVPAHTHNPVKVTGQAATETASGWKDYYKCDCDALFEDEDGTTPIENLDTWKAAGGNGYTPPLAPKRYTVTFTQPKHGKIEVKANGNTITSGGNVAKGTEVTVKATPNFGYRLDSLKANGDSIKTSKKFTMPDNNVTITATFKEELRSPKIDYKKLIVAGVITSATIATVKTVDVIVKEAKKAEAEAAKQEAAKLLEEAKTTAQQALSEAVGDSSHSLVKEYYDLGCEAISAATTPDEVMEATYMYVNLIDGVIVVTDTKIHQNKLTAYKNGKIKVSFENPELDGTVNYQVVRSTKKDFSKSKKTYTVKVKDQKTLTLTNAKNLKKGTRYYYKVRAKVELSDGTTLYTAWSNVRYTKCKKTR